MMDTAHSSKPSSRLKDLTGQVFGRLTVIARDPNNPRGHAMWRCRCQCGQFRSIPGIALRSGQRTGCGCVHVHMDLTGQTFTRLTVLHEAGKNAGGRILWRCRCTCGNFIITAGKRLHNGQTKSCGCYKKEGARARFSTHGMGSKNSPSPAYKSWCGIIDRCTNSKNKSFCNYGGRGIQVCARFRDFTAFFTDLGERPPQTSIDRENNNLHYSCGKCDECQKKGWHANTRWAVSKTQANNKRNNHIITFEGKTLTLAQWAEHLGIHKGTISTRFARGWTVDKTLGTHIDKKKRNKRVLFTAASPA